MAQKWEAYKNYDGTDLGANYTREKTDFRLWAPSADEVVLCLYREGNGDNLIEKREMARSEGDTWFVSCEGDLNKTYYTYLVTVDGVTREAGDPYAKAAGVNGVRSMVIDLEQTNPDGFAQDHGPVLEKYTDAIVCEISVADITGDRTAGAKHPGKYLGLAESGTRTESGKPTGLDYLAELGITHVQLMPSYDFGSIDESKPEEEQYNWGYDPVNYNVPEGSYATDAFHGEVRVREFKEMVQALHRKGLGVIMDVVYNHTYSVEDCCLHRCVPNYYHRQREDRSYSNASACGNEIASERPMVQKYILDSVRYWASEYHIDGFRFDLMGVLDLDTLRKVYLELKEMNPNIIVYGEGWTGDSSVLDEELRCMKSKLKKIDGVGAFSDDIRDGIRGDVFISKEPGFITGRAGTGNDIRYSVVGASYHPQVDYTRYRYSDGPWAKNPCDVVNYISCHDNLTLWDKIHAVLPDISEEEALERNRLGAAVVMTSQGIPFFLSGEEFGRTKPIQGSDEVSENSYNLPLYTNAIRYDRAEAFSDLLSYYQGLMQLRKAHAGFRMDSMEEVQRKLTFIDVNEDVVAYMIKDETEEIFVAFNPTLQAVEIEIPSCNHFSVLVNKNRAGLAALDEVEGSVTVEPLSAMVAISKQ